MTATAATDGLDGEQLAAMVCFWPSAPWEPLATADQHDMVQWWSDTLQSDIIPACVRQAHVVDPLPDGREDIVIDASELAGCVQLCCYEMRWTKAWATSSRGVLPSA